MREKPYFATGLCFRTENPRCESRRNPPPKTLRHLSLRATRHPAATVRFGASCPPRIRHPSFHEPHRRESRPRRSTHRRYLHSEPDGPAFANPDTLRSMNLTAVRAVPAAQPVPHHENRRPCPPRNSDSSTTTAVPPPAEPSCPYLPEDRKTAPPTRSSIVLSCRKAVLLLSRPAHKDNLFEDIVKS